MCGGLAGLHGLKSHEARAEDRPLLIPALNCLLFQKLAHQGWREKGDEVKRRKNGGMKPNGKKNKSGEMRESGPDMAAYGHE